MTAAAWLGVRTPSPASALHERVRAWVEDHPGPVPDGFLDRAELRLTRLLESRCRSRDCALDLLAIDALVTFAFEAACETPEELDACAARATARLSHAAVRPRG